LREKEKQDVKGFVGMKPQRKWRWGSRWNGCAGIKPIIFANNRVNKFIA
jgi:hypothetical protein